MANYPYYPFLAASPFSFFFVFFFGGGGGGGGRGGLVNASEQMFQINGTFTFQGEQLCKGGAVV